VEAKNLYIIAGCNGAGKTTASFTILPSILNCKEFVNADEIAKGLSPFQPEAVSFEAGRIMLHRIEELVHSGEDFAFETTLASKSYRGRILQAQSLGYRVILLFFWLRDMELAKYRVSSRVKEGGHNIPVEVIERRYSAGIRNLFDIYLGIVDEAMIFDNSDGKHELIAEKSGNSPIIAVSFEKFNQIKQFHEKT
jgi:predicted ABC-type ATPase